MKRYNSYYFVLKVNNSVIKKSLRTSNYIYANILKYKLLNKVKEMDNEFNRNLQIINTGNGILLNAETDEEKLLVAQFEKTLIEKAKRLKRAGNDIKLEKTEEEKLKLNLKYCCNEFIEYKKTNSEEKNMIKYSQAVSLLENYFTHKQRIDKILSKDAMKFHSFLQKLPKNWTKNKLLKDKNIRLLIDNKSKLLNGLDIISTRTSDEHLKRVKTIFDFFELNNFIIKNPFNHLKTISKKKDTTWFEFKVKDLKELLEYINDNQSKEDYNLIKFMLFTGLRRGEVSKITISNIELDKTYIEIHGTKTDNAKRIMIIHKDIINLVKEQMENKTDDDLLFYNNTKSKSIVSRESEMGKKFNEYILKVVGEEKKKNLNIHSIRKNFTQKIFISDKFNMLEIETMVGHSSNNITDTHYLRGKRDYKKLKQKLDSVDFSEFFPKNDSINTFNTFDIF